MGRAGRKTANLFQYEATRKTMSPSTSKIFRDGKIENAILLKGVEDIPWKF
jgi:hypothetical protein